MKLRIAHLYPRLMNLYGDRGNILTLRKRCQWRDITPEVDNIEPGDHFDPCQYDLIFLGGGQDREQLLIHNDLQKTAQRAYCSSRR